MGCCEVIGMPLMWKSYLTSYAYMHLLCNFSHARLSTRAHRWSGKLPALDCTGLEITYLDWSLVMRHYPADRAGSDDLLFLHGLILY